ncbi:MAG: zinc-dependent alcohol dehydrogenase family protein [Candidatus Promineifilaceae bacterium]
MNESKMKAMSLYRPGEASSSPLEYGEVSIPNPGPGQLRLKISVCGVCHTDLHTVEGDLELPVVPIIPGHQVVGLVDELGPGVERFEVGDRVGVAWLNWACGDCEYCSSGLENLCSQARFTGLHSDGGYAQYLVVDENFAFPIPRSFTDIEAAPLMCAGIVGYRALLLSGIKPGGRLGLYGFGASAHLVIQVARYWECEVYVFTRGEQHRRLAEDLGAVWTGSAETRPPKELDAGVIFAPVGWIVPHALSYLKPGGTLAINAIHMSNIPEMPYSLIYGERVLRSVANFTRKDAVEFLETAAEIPVRCEVESFSLEDANAVLQSLKESQIKASAVLDIPQ